MIGIPYALAEAGFGLGLLLLLLVAGLTDYSLRLMVRAAHLSGTTSYQVYCTVYSVHTTTVKQSRQ